MSSGKGGSGKRTVYCGTIAGVLGGGPAYSIQSILVNAKAIWSGPVLRSSSANPAVLNLQGYGTGRWYWGTEDQPADTKLVRYGAQPAYRGSVVLVLDDIRFGNNGETNPPNIEVIWRRHPDQDIITTIGAEQDAGFTANGAAVGCELLRSWDWLGLPASALDVDSFAALAAVIAADLPAGSTRPRSSIAPLSTDQVPIRTALADCGLIADAWFRVGLDGRLQAGYWPRGGPAGTVTEFAYADLTESPEIEGADVSDLPNAISVEYTDSAKLHKANSTLVKDDAAIRNAQGRVRKQTAKRSMLLTIDQAMSHGADLLAQASTPTITATLTVFRSLAVRPDGQPLRPGDYFVFPVQLLPELPPAPRLFRLVRREYGLTGPITLIGELDRSAPAIDTVSASAVVDAAVVLPPVNWVRIFALPAAELAIYAVAARPSDTVIGYDVRYDDDEDGDFPAVGNQPGCALPLLVQASCSAVAETISVRLLPVAANGANPRRDEHLLRNWSGGLTEARDDRLLLIVLKRDGADIERVGAVDYLEVMSVAGPATITATDTFTVPVLRGRRGTSALAFGGGDWDDYEAWLVPSATLRPQDHADWLPAAQAGSTLWFRFRPYAQGAEYHGETAYAERQRRVTAAEPLQEFDIQEDETDTPTVPYQIPAGYLADFGDTNDTYTDGIPPTVLYPPSSALTVTCKRRGGLAEKVGYLEFLATPDPQKYLVGAVAGTGTARGHFLGDCSDSPSENAEVWSYSGSNTWDPVTGVLTKGVVLTITQTISGLQEVLPAQDLPCGTSNCVHAVTKTPTTCTLTADHTCCGNGFGGYSRHDDLVVSILSSPDSCANAVARLKATLAVWAEISAAGGHGATSVRGSCALSVEYQEALLIVEGAGYLAGWEYVIRVRWGRRAAGTADPFVAYQTDDYAAPSDGTTAAFHEEIEYPIEEGWETACLGVEVTS